MELPHKPRLDSAQAWLWQAFCGMCMGAADLVPGISGGTIAFIMGIYQGLIASLKTLNPSAFALLLKLRFRVFFDAVAWEFLLALISGASLSFFLFAEGFDKVLNDEVYRVSLYAAFMGLILASSVFCARQVGAWRAPCFAALVVGGVAAYLLTGADLGRSSNREGLRVQVPAEKIANPANKALQNYQASTQTLMGLSEKTLAAMAAKGIVAHSALVFDESGQARGRVADFAASLYAQSKLDLWMVACGATAICAMLLPGISGSYLLTILGAYPTVIGALADLVRSLKQFSFDADAFFILFSLAIGIVIGAVGFARVLSWLLKNAHDITIAFLTGCMLGALRSVWPYWTYAYELLPLKLDKGPQIVVVEPLIPDFSLLSTWHSFGFMILGFGAVFIVEALANWKARRLATA